MEKKDYDLEDSGKRTYFPSGLMIEDQDGKTAYHLLPVEIIEDLAVLLTKGAKKYAENNWQKSCTIEEANIYKSKAFRHFIAWCKGDEKEDHKSACLFNMYVHDNTWKNIVNSQE